MVIRTLEINLSTDDGPILDFRFNLGCIVNKIYLNSEIKTNL